MIIESWVPVALRSVSNPGQNGVAFYAKAELRCLDCGEFTTVESPRVVLKNDRQTQPANYVGQVVTAITAERKCSVCGRKSGVPDRQIEELRVEITKRITVDWIQDQLESSRSMVPITPPDHKIRLGREGLVDIIAQARKKVPARSIWRHYKKADSRYKVIVVGLLEASESASVTYQEQTPEKLVWTLPLSEFLSTVVGKPDHQPRFVRIQTPRKAAAKKTTAKKATSRARSTKRSARK